MEVFGETLFPEIEGLFGLDQVLYDDEECGHLTNTNKLWGLPEDSDVSLPISHVQENKHSPTDNTAGSYCADYNELLAESNSLLDQLIQQNTNDFSEASAQNFDNLNIVPHQPDGDASLKKLVSDLFSDSQDYYEPLSPVPTTSPVPTLPSEPSSPTAFFHLDEHDGNIQTVDELDVYLQNLLEDEYIAPAIPEAVSPGYSSELSPSLSEHSLYSLSGTTESPETPPGKVKKAPKRKTPYSKLPQPRKERKKLQNKNAANRYRQKKKDEMAVVSEQESELQSRNQQLKSEVTNLEREITCMKELLSEVFDCHSF